MKQVMKNKFSNIFYIFIATFLINSCSALSPYKVPILQGNIFEEEDIEKLSEGLSRDQVKFIFGTALIQDPFHSNRWDYYYSIQVGDVKKLMKVSSLYFSMMKVLLIAGQSKR